MKNLKSFFCRAKVQGNALVYGDAEVRGSARVCGDATIGDGALIESDRDWFTASNVGSENLPLTVYKGRKGQLRVTHSWFCGSVEEFLVYIKRCPQ
ncbi:hypothetical protein [Phocoenobacter skyensis]|uniref:Polymer-forming protein n=1 Tax=Phocoenobacter skyensis TaxID=97481 RepID=A0ABT9JIE3_9PAST|nr:hypothetical protein [Pasteurella skyensis]MDP8078360.1 hypothetical protein [Pasteurella skyensis]MDP8084548.1 hypothetical protein [Pasteurella skyensis]